MTSIRLVILMIAITSTSLYGDVPAALKKVVGGPDSTGPQIGDSSADGELRNSLPSGKQLNLAIRAAIYKNRKQLVEYLSNPKTRSLVCTPVPNDSYELFQESVRSELDVLWDLDLSASKYGLNKRERQSVNHCSAQMGKYLDNFKMWQKLSKAN